MNPGDTQAVPLPDSAVLAGLADAVPLYLASFTRDRRYIYANARCAAYFGLRPDEIVGRYLVDVIGDAALAVLEPYITRVLAGQPASFERSFDFGQGGQPQTLRTTLTPMCDAAGAVIGWHGAAEDVTDARRVEARLHDFRFVLHRTNDFVGISDLAFRPLFVNDAGAALVGFATGVTVDDSVTVFDFIQPSHHAYLREEFFPRVLRDGHAVTDIRFRHFTTGDSIWMEYSVLRMDDEHGRPCGYATISRNLTEAKTAESLLMAAVREKELSLQRFRELADSLPQIVWSVDADGTHDYFNQRFYDLMGVPSGTATDPWSSIHPDDARRLGAEWQRALATGEPFEQEFRLAVPGESKYRWYLGRTVPVRDADGRVVRWYGTSTEIQEQKQAADALEQSRARLRAALDASDTGTFRWDIATNTLDWDTNLKRLFGLPADARVTSLDDFIGLVHPDDRGSVIAACERCVNDGVDFQQEFRVVRPDGSIAWLFDKGRIGTDGERRFMTGACTDVTERRLTEEALRLADREKDEFLGMVSHELRTPLSPMVVALSLLEQGDERARGRALTVLGRQVTRMRALVDDLLDLSRVRLGRLDLRHEPVDLRDVVRHAADTARPAMEARRHTLHLALPDDAPVVIGDAGRLGQVVDNLLANATKYTPDGGRIEVTLAVGAQQVQLRVRDSGIGIDPARLARVFELFEQEEAGRARSEGGLGIGLALVERLVRLHGGTVDAHSDGVNLGAEFVVLLPRAAA